MKDIEIWIRGREDSLRLPVVEGDVGVSRDTNDTEVNLYEVGDRLLKGKVGLYKFNYSSFFPGKDYRFLDVPYSVPPYTYVEKLKKWQEGDETVRLIVTETDINLEMRITSFEHKEADGSGDVYYSLEMTECPPISKQKEAKPGEFEKAERRPRGDGR